MSDRRPSVAAVIVTHNSERWLPELIASIGKQTQSLDAVYVIDDHSTDNTVDFVQAAGWNLALATSLAPNITTRIAHNFTQGVNAAREHDIVILSDHDDVWLPHRVAHQVTQLTQHPQHWYLASNGRIMGSAQTLRDTFPVPDTWNNEPRRKQLRYALRHSLATGGASAVRPAALLNPKNKAIPIPPNWLHDRWWSLAATSKRALLIDQELVIEYRVQAEQRVGLEKGRQGTSMPTMGREDFSRIRAVLRLM